MERPYRLVQVTDSPVRPHPDMATNDIERHCFIGTNRTPETAQLYRSRIESQDQGSLERIMSPVVLAGEDDEKPDSHIILDHDVEMMEINTSWMSYSLLSAIFVGAETNGVQPLDFYAKTIFSPASVGMKWMQDHDGTLRDRSDIISLRNMSSPEIFPYESFNPRLADTAFYHLDDLTSHVSSNVFREALHPYVSFGSEVVDRRTAWINSLSARFALFSKRNYRERRATYTKRVLNDITTTWKVNHDLPSRVYDIMADTTFDDFLIAPQTLLRPAFTDFEDGWDYERYGRALRKAESIHDLNNIGMRFLLIDTIDDDERVIDLIDNLDMPMSWWVSKEELRQTLNQSVFKTYNPASPFEGIPITDNITRMIGMLYS